MNELEAELGRLGPGQHLCLLFDDNVTVERTLAPYYRQGLARNERCLFISDAENISAAIAVLTRAGLDTKAEMERGALRVLTATDAYLPAGRFEPEVMIELLEREIAQAHADGFSGLRGSGEMSWCLAGAPGSDRVIEYEAMLAPVFARNKFLSICRYDTRRFSPEMIREVLRVHPCCVVGSLVCPCPYYEPPDMALGKCSEAERLRWSVARMHEARAQKLALEAALESRERALHARDEFLGVAAHELRTPLTALRLRVESAARRLEREAPGSSVGAGLKAAEKAARRLNALVEQMLDASRVGTGQPITLSREPTDLVELTQEVIDRFQPTHGAIRLAAAGPLRGNWDRARLDEVLTNLLSNACKYCPGAPIDVALEQEGDRATLTVRDRGMGIAESDQQRIFEPFERAVSSTRYGGLGLGLYIVRLIAEAHGGQVRLESAPGRGASFTIELPKMAS